MQSTPDITPIKKYATRYAATLCDAFFEHHTVIEGPQVVSLANVHHVNLMVVKNIFQQWQVETNRLKSPLFNYQAPEVREALAQFMGVLSQHIRIERTHFEPLLRKSTQETLLLLFYPGYYFKQFFAQLSSPIALEEELWPLLKYIRLHEEFTDQLKINLLQYGEQVTTEQALAVLDALVAEQDHIDAPHTTLQRFDEKLSVGLFELAPSWSAMPYTADANEFEETSIFTEKVEGPLPALAPEEEALQQEIVDEFSKPFLDETFDFYEEDDEESDMFVGHHLKGSFDPVNDNVFISNQEDILNAAIIEDFYDDSPPATSSYRGAEDIHEKAPSFMSQNPFARVTNDLTDENTAEEEEPFVFEEEASDDEQVQSDWFEEASGHAYETPAAADLHIEETPAPSNAAPTEPDAFFEKPATSPSRVEPVQPQKEETPPASPVSAPKEEPYEETIYDMLAKRKAKEEQVQQPSVLDKLRAGQIKKLQGNIPLHQRFKFQNDLFGGDADAFNEAIALIDQSPDYHDALALIKSRFVLKYDWDFSHESTLEFISMVEDKFD